MGPFGRFVRAWRAARGGRVSKRGGAIPWIIPGGGGELGYGISGGIEQQFVRIGGSYDRIYRNVLEASPTIGVITTVVSRMFRSLRLELRPDRGEGDPLDNHPLLDIFNRTPNEFCTASEFWQRVAEELVHGGECIIRVHRMGRQVKRLIIWPYDEVDVTPLAPDYYQPDGETDQTVEPIHYRFRGEEVPYKVGDVPNILHVRMSTDRYRVLRADDPWRGLQSDILTSIYASAYRSEYFRQGGSPRIVAVQKPIEGLEQESEKSTADLTTAMTGFWRTVKAGFNWGDGTARVMPEGLEPSDLGPKSTEDPMMTKAAKAVDERIAAAAGLPLLFLNNMDRSTYNNSRQQQAVIVRDAIQPRLNAFTAAIERDLLIPMGGADANLGAYVDTDKLIEDEAVVWNKIVLDRYDKRIIDLTEARADLGLGPNPALEAEIAAEKAALDEQMMDRDDEDEDEEDEKSEAEKDAKDKAKNDDEED